MRALFPTRALALLLTIGLLDLVATAVLYAAGKIDEMNPLMAPVLAHGVGSFIAVKSATLLAAWALFARSEVRQARLACLVGSAIYLGLLAYTAL